MKFEKLSKENNGNKKFLYGFITCAVLLIVFNLFMSYAKYKVVDSVKLAEGTITYSAADLNVIAMYKNDGNGDETIETIPEGNYELSNESYCLVGSDIDNKIKNIFEYKGNKIYIAIDTKGTKCYLYFKKKQTAEEVLANLFKGFTTADRGTNFSTGSNGVLKVTGVDTGNHTKTLYEAEDNDGVSYFFRGKANDNWVQFAGNRWRIIRINGDGTIRMIFQCKGDTCTDTTGPNTNAESNVAYKSEPYNNNTYIGYYYGKASASSYSEAHTSLASNPSTIAEKVNSWYISSGLSKYEQYIDQNAGFCNDRQKVTGVGTAYNGTGYSDSSTSYAAWGRVYKNGNFRQEQFPTLKCGVSATTVEAQETSVAVNTTAYKRDLFTKEGANKGNGILPYPIGLITADEVLLAGGYYGAENSSYYLNTGQKYWTMSPYYSISSGASIFYVDRGFLNFQSANLTVFAMRPVINLKSTTTFGGGSGSSSDPFVVATN